MGEYLHNVILGRMSRHNDHKYPKQMMVKDKRDGRIFRCTYGGYDPKYNRHLYSLINIETNEGHYETPEGYITHNCEILENPLEAPK